MDEMNNTPVQNEPSETAPKTCPHCGKPLTADALFCGSCGTRLNGDSAAAPAPTPTAPTPSFAAPTEDTTPLKTTDYLLMFLLMCVPIVGIIIFLIWAFSGDTNINRRNFSRAYLIYCLIALALGFFIGIIFGLFVIAVAGELMVYSTILPALLL